MNKPAPEVFRDGNHIVMPGMASAHSHAFQRALRARTQRRTDAAKNFWSWRELMYDLAGKLTPDDVFQISRFAFVELSMSGVTAVGEFHYLHHQPDGTPYHDRLELADAVVSAAREAGMQISLIRTAYFRAGHGKQLHPVQRRFCDTSVADVLRDVESLQARFKDDPLVKIALAAHSIRAVERQPLRELAGFAQQNHLPFHMHVAEQRQEIKECLHEYGLTPVALLAQDGLLHKRFVAIHATHLTSEEILALGEAQAFVCLCRTTERDLGDGLPQTTQLLQAGVKLCVGVDSHAAPDAFEEIRAVELDERSRTEARLAAAEAPQLLAMATQNGHQAIGFEDWLGSKVYLNASEPGLAASCDALLADAVIFAGTPRAVDKVVVGGKTIVSDGLHIKYDEACKGYEKSMKRLGLLDS